MKLQFGWFSLRKSGWDRKILLCLLLTHCLILSFFIFPVVSLSSLTVYLAFPEGLKPPRLPGSSLSLSTLFRPGTGDHPWCRRHFPSTLKSPAPPHVPPFSRLDGFRRGHSGSWSTRFLHHLSVSLPTALASKMFHPYSFFKG